MAALEVDELSRERSWASALVASTSPMISARGKERQALYDEIFGSFPAFHGKHVSRSARDAAGLSASTLVYGEIEYASFYLTLEKISSRLGSEHGVMAEPQNDVFYDLGSGVGKPTIAAALSFPFGRCVGLEVLQPLVDASREAQLVYETKRPADGADVEFYCADITDLDAYDWSDGTVVFANSTCFDERLMSKLADLAERLRPGAFVVTLTRRLPSPLFHVDDSKLYQMSWGGATVVIQHRLHDADVLPRLDGAFADLRLGPRRTDAEAAAALSSSSEDVAD